MPRRTREAFRPGRTLFLWEVSEVEPQVLASLYQSVLPLYLRWRWAAQGRPLKVESPSTDEPPRARDAVQAYLDQLNVERDRNRNPYGVPTPYDLADRPIES